MFLPLDKVGATRITSCMGSLCSGQLNTSCWQVSGWKSRVELMSCCLCQYTILYVHISFLLMPETHFRQCFVLCMGVWGGSVEWDCTHLVTTDHSGMPPIAVFSNSYKHTYYPWSLYNTLPTGRHISAITAPLCERNLYVEEVEWSMILVVSCTFQRHKLLGSEYLSAYYALQ